MYRFEEQSQVSSENFELPFEGKLSEDNRWVIMASLIPWSDFEEEYASIFTEEIGAPAKSFRMALGALIIKEKLGISDRETVEQIKENPYLQYFIGISSYSNETPFDASMLVHFRQRIGIDLVNRINQKMVKEMLDNSSIPVKKKLNQPKNKGKLILDATCAPSDISYPTDLGLLNQARKHTEKIIDLLYKQIKNQLDRKPRTYRKLARKNYLKVAKKRRPFREERRKSLKQQLQYIKRNISHIKQLVNLGANLSELSHRQYKILLVVSEVYRQQSWLYENNKKSINYRIVSLSQPHIRPIVRGKAGKTVEFGAKLSASCFDGYVFLDRISWNNFNESTDLKIQIESFKKYTGNIPESVHVDKIYRTQKNRAWCKERGIRISGPPLGRPPVNISKEKKKQAASDEKIRSCIEGKFGQGKRRFSLNCVMTKLSHTSKTAIAITFLVMNLSTYLSRLLRAFLCLFFGNLSFLRYDINKHYVFLNFRKQKLIFSSSLNN
ncbi:MAG: IS5 family transposase [Cyanobacteria bacterium P01_C01_bin.38]